MEWTLVPFVGMVGASKFALKAGQKSYLRPEKLDDNKRYHDVAIGVKGSEGDRVISTTRWPKSKTTRYYVFFYVNPKSGRITYRAVDEFIPPRAPQTRPLDLR